MERYLLQILELGEVKSDASIMTSSEIINRIDFQDCYDENLEVYRVSKFGEIEKLKIHGVWHNMNDPLYIKVTDMEGNIVFDGYGTDH